MNKKIEFIVKCTVEIFLNEANKFFLQCGVVFFLFSVTLGAQILMVWLGFLLFLFSFDSHNFLLIYFIFALHFSMGGKDPGRS